MHTGNSRTLSASRKIVRNSLRALPAGKLFRCISSLVLNLGNAVAAGVFDGGVDQKIPCVLGRRGLNAGRGAAEEKEEDDDAVSFAFDFESWLCF